MLGLGALVVWVGARQDLLMVESVEFVGAHHAKIAALRHLSGVRNGQRIWEVDARDVSRRVLAHPWVKRATTEVSWSGQVRVRVEEFEPVALMMWDGRLLYVDRGGWPFVEADSDYLDLPVIVGLGPEIDRRDPEIARWVVRDALWLIDALDEQGLVRGSRISDLTFGYFRGLTVRTIPWERDQPPSEVVFGFEDLPRQVRRLAKIISEGVDLAAGVYIDLAPSRGVIVRPLGSTERTGGIEVP